MANNLGIVWSTAYIEQAPGGGLRSTVVLCNRAHEAVCLVLAEAGCVDHHLCNDKHVLLLGYVYKHMYTRVPDGR